MKKTTENLHTIVEINSLHLRNFPLTSFENLEIQGGVYLKTTYSESNKACFTSLTNNLNKLYWETQIPLYITSMDSSLFFSLGGIIFGDFTDNKEFKPWEILRFQVDMNDFQDGMFFIPLKKTLKAPKLSQEFMEFLKRSSDSKQLDYFKVIFMILIKKK